MGESRSQTRFFLKSIKKKRGRYYSPYESPSPVLEWMLKADPSLAGCIDISGQSPLSLSIQTGEESDAKALLKSIESHKISLSEEEVWLKKSFEGDTSFGDEAFCALDSKLKQKIYQVANTYGNEELVARLNRLGMGFKKGPYKIKMGKIISEQMDAIETRQAVEAFLLDLRQKGCLLTKSEFEKMKLADNGSFKEKGIGIGRLIGRNFVEKKIEKLQLKSIKVPKKILVIHPYGQHRSNDELTISVNSNYGPLKINSNDFLTYSEIVKPSLRLVQFEEMEELIRVIEETRFGDIWPENFIIGADGIYFIDTEYKSFDLPFDYNKLYRLLSMLTEKDGEKFKALIKERRIAYEQECIEKKEKREQKQEEEEKYLSELGFTYRYRPLHFSIEKIVSS